MRAFLERRPYCINRNARRVFLRIAKNAGANRRKGNAGESVRLRQPQRVGVGVRQIRCLAVIAAARHAGVDIQTACEALSAFKNVKRRMEIKGTVNGITVYDDFAHHPTAIKTTIEGLRQRVGNARILAVLEPRSNTMKLGTMKAALPESLKDADQVFCYAGGVDWDVAEALEPLASKLHVGQDFDAFVAEIVKNAEAGDHILVMSNGGFGGIHGKLLEALK